jgi:hypothetical protein
MSEQSERVYGNLYIVVLSVIAKLLDRFRLNLVLVVYHIKNCSENLISVRISYMKLKSNFSNFFNNVSPYKK